MDHGCLPAIVNSTPSGKHTKHLDNHHFEQVNQLFLWAIFSRELLDYQLVPVPRLMLDGNDWQCFVMTLGHINEIIQKLKPLDEVSFSWTFVERKRQRSISFNGFHYIQFIDLSSKLVLKFQSERQVMWVKQCHKPPVTVHGLYQLCMVMTGGLFYPHYFHSFRLPKLTRKRGLNLFC